MNRKLRSLLVVLGIVSLGAISWWLATARSARYQGKGVQYWMLQTRSSSLDDNPGLKAIGTNAVLDLAGALQSSTTYFDRYSWLRHPKVQWACTNLGLGVKWTQPGREVRSKAAFSLLLLSHWHRLH